MTSLRQRMIEDLHLRGYAERTVGAYVSVVAQLAQYHHTAPDRLSEDQLRAYLLHLTSDRAVARRHQRVVYAALLREAAAAVQTIADDRDWVGGTLGILAVLHTWSRTLEYHPHAHLLVTAGGLSADAAAWVSPAHRRFLLPGYVLSPIFRAKIRDALTRAGLHDEVDARVWQRRWTVHVQPIGTGHHATLYLSRYVYRVALTNQRLQRFSDGRVTFRYTHGRTSRDRSRSQSTRSSPDFSNTSCRAASRKSGGTAS